MAINTPYIGQMDRKIKVYEFTKTQNDLGEEKETEVLVASPFAFVEEMGGGESIDGKILHATNRSYIIRYNANISRMGSNYIVEDSGVRFNITHVMQLGRRSHLKLVTENVE